MNHSFNVDIAVKYGIEEAIILENMYFWLEKNKANKKHLIDGHIWTYNSQEALTILFPYMNRSKIQRVMVKLEKEELILRANYNEKKYDKTTWYTLTPLGYSLFKMNNALFNMNNPLSQNEQPIPDINTDINTDKIWSLYPNKKGKASAMKSIPKLLKSIGYDKLEKCISKFVKENKKTDIKFIQYGSTFFNGGYMDYMEETKEIASKPKFEIVEGGYLE